jgi:hypothetical protein
MKTALCAAAIALLSASVSAHAAVNQFMFHSDTLTVGGTTVFLIEGDESEPVSITVPITETGQV